MDKKPMPNIIKLNPNSKDTVIESLKKVLKLAEEDKLDGFLLAGFTNDDSMVVAQGNINLIDMQQLVSFLQIQVISKVQEETVNKEIL